MSKEFVNDLWRDVKNKIRDAAANRGELIESNLDDVKPIDRIIEIPSHLQRKPGESPRAWVNRIRESAATDDAAREEWFNIKGVTNNREGFTKMDPSGNPREGYEWTPEEESAAEKEREKLGE